MSILKSNIPLVIAAAAIIFLGMFSQAMLRPLSHDEHMYIYAGVLIQNYDIYKDFAYLQMPYLPLLYGIIFKLTGNSDYLFWGRLVSLIAMLLSSLLILSIIYKKTGNIYLGLGGLILFACCNPIIEIMPYAWNHVIPLAFTLLAFSLFLKAFENKGSGFWYLLLSGISIAIASGTKLTYALMPLPFIITMMLFPKNRRFGDKILKSLLPYSLGIFIGLIPLLYIFLNTPADIFYFNNIGYHQANSSWRSLTGWPTGITFMGKAEFLWREIAFPSNLAIILALLFIIVYSVRGKSSSKFNLRQFWEMDSILCILIIGLSSIVSLTPEPLFSSYFAMPVPYVIIFVAIIYGKLRRSEKMPFNILLICLLVITSIYGGARLLRYLPKLPDRSKWTMSEISGIGEEIRKKIDIGNNNEQVATLAPLYVLEAGLPGFMQFSTGSFLYRIGDMVTDSERKRYVGVSPKSLAYFLDKNPSAALLVGYEESLDQPFIDYAIKNHYEMVKLETTEGILYLPKAADK